MAIILVLLLNVEDAADREDTYVLDCCCWL